jgi:hypothetical protein
MLQMFHLNVLKVDRVLHMAGGQRPAAGLRLLPHAFLAWCALPSPLPPLPSLPSISPRQFEFGGETLPDEHAGGAMLMWWPQSNKVRTVRSLHVGTSSRGDVRALVTPFNKRTKMVQIDQTNRSEVRNLWAP